MFVNLALLVLSNDPNSDAYGIVNPSGFVFLSSFSVSVFSVTLGIAKLLKDGPCRFIPRDSYGCGFVSVMLMTLVTLLLKGATFFFFLTSWQNYDQYNTTAVIIWMGLYVFPHLLYVRKLALRLQQHNFLYYAFAFPVFHLLLSVPQFCSHYPTYQFITKSFQM